MIKKTSIAIIAASFLLTVNLDAKTVSVKPEKQEHNATNIFKQGFEEGIKATRFQALNDGFRPKSVKMRNNFVLVFDTTNIAYAEALYMQYLAAKEGFEETYITKNTIIFGSFAREIDAQEAQKKIAKMFGVGTKIENCVGKTFMTEPLLFSDFSDELFAVSATKKESEKPKKRLVAKPKKAEEKVVEKQIVLKQPTYSYYKANMNSTKESSSNYHENKIVGASKQYVLDKKVVTPEGEIFYKAKGENLFFKDVDVEIK